MLALSTLTFFSVSGGPFGLEVAVAAGGPARTIWFILLLTLVAALPSALMVAELSAALPGRGGFVYWVERGLSPAIGSLNGWLALVNSAVDASAYPGITFDYLAYGLVRWAGWPPLPPSARMALCVAMTGGVCAVNMAGITVAASTAVGLAAFSLAPFGLMALMALARPAASYGNIAAALSASSAAPAANLPLCLAVCMWSTSGFDAISFVSAEVDRGSSKTMPRAMGLAVGVMMLATVVPILVSCAEGGRGGGGTAWERWALGSFSDAGEALGGRWLGCWACAAGVASSCGLLNAFMCTSARNVQAMACKGMLPAVLRGESGAEATPAPALVFTSGCILLLAYLPFNELVELDMSLYAVSLALEQIALIRLRYTEPNLPRPYRIPLGRQALAVAFLPQFGLCAVTISFSLRSVGRIFMWALLIGSGVALRTFGPRYFRPRAEGVLGPTGLRWGQLGAEPSARFRASPAPPAQSPAAAHV